MRILVVTPTLGESPWLADTIASVAAQHLDIVHVLVAPATRVRELATKFSRTRVVAESDTHSGLYSAINVGLTATTDWDAFTYINDDDLLLSSFARVAARTNAGETSVVYGGVRLIDSAGRRLGAIPISSWPRHHRLLYAQRLEPVYQHGTLITRPAWERHGGFAADLRYCGDSELLARLCVAGVPFRCATRQSVAAFRLRAGQLTKHRTALAAERNQVDWRLGLLTSRRTLSLRWARFVFRLENLPIYLERIVRHGFVTFDELLERGR